MRILLPLAAAALTLPNPVRAAENVPVPGFRSIQLRGGGEVAVRPGPVQRVTIVDGSSQVTRFRVDRGGQLRISACDQRCPQRYRLRIVIETPRVPDLAVSGGGILRAEGSFAPTPSFSAAVDGGGQVDARAIVATDVTAAVNGGGRVVVHPRRRLTAAVNGGGEIRYLGNPQVMRAVNGGGAIQPGT